MHLLFKLIELPSETCYDRYIRCTDSLYMLFFGGI